jgi:hypothetical protein
MLLLLHVLQQAGDDGDDYLVATCT